MAQFDVHRNSGRLRETIPYVLIAQSSLFDGYRRRLVVPLVRRGELDGFAALAGMPMNRGISIEGVDVVSHPWKIVSVASTPLGEKVSSLADQGERLGEALDALLTRSWA